MVERLLAKQKVVGSSPIVRSIPLIETRCIRRGTQVAKGEVCKTSIRRFESDPRLQHKPQYFPALHEWSAILIDMRY